MVCATSRKKAVHHLKVSAAQATPWAASSAAFTSPATMVRSSAFSAHPCLCASTAALPRKMQTRLPQWLQRQLKKSKLKNFIYSKKSGSKSRFFVTAWAVSGTCILSQYELAKLLDLRSEKRIHDEKENEQQNQARKHHVLMRAKACSFSRLSVRSF